MSAENNKHIIVYFDTSQHPDLPIGSEAVARVASVPSGEHHLTVVWDPKSKPEALPKGSRVSVKYKVPFLR